MISCATCAVERDEPLPPVCPICSDERQYVPPSGQRWLRAADTVARGVFTDLEPGLVGIETDPALGIGQQAKLVVTQAGSLLWDPTGYVDEDMAARVASAGPVLAIAASHPHMFGAQVRWSQLLGGVPILVNAADAHWVGRRSPAIVQWSDRYEVTPELTLRQLGGHFPGAAIAHWSAAGEHPAGIWDGAGEHPAGLRGGAGEHPAGTWRGAGEHPAGLRGGAGEHPAGGVVLGGDTIMVTPRREVTFMRSYPNAIPLSPTVVARIAAAVAPLRFERLYNNFRGVVPQRADAVVQESAERYIRWARGDFDHLT